MNSLSARDLKVLWHPCTQMHDHESQLPLLHIARGEGAWLIGRNGERWLDAISSWWTSLFGHCHPHLVAALTRQLGELDHVLLAGCSHEPAVRLAEVLIAHAPSGLSKVFYADNGSAATEVALKMSLHYWRNCGQPRKQRLVALRNSYHGETIGALSVSDVGLYREPYAPLLFQPLLVSAPDSFERPAEISETEHVAHCVSELRSLLEQGQDTIAAMIVEPLVQCAGGMRMYPAAYLQAARALCDEFGVHLIADEIAVGMGRSGRLWGCDHAGIRPDFLLTSKGLTGGTLPLSAVLTTDVVYQAFYAEFSSRRAFLHSHSYTGNPLACSAAVACFELIDAPGFWDAQAQRVDLLAEVFEPLRAWPQVGELRQTGMILALELVADRSTRRPYPPGERRGLRVHRQALTAGVLLRPLGNVVYVMPPYCVGRTELTRIRDAAAEAIEMATRD